MGQKFRKRFGSARDLIYLPLLAGFFVLMLVFGSDVMGWVLGLLNLAVLLWIAFVLVRDPVRIPVNGRERLGGLAMLLFFWGIGGWYLWRAVTQGAALDAAMLVISLILTGVLFQILCDILGLRQRK